MVSTKISTPKTNKANNYLSNNVINKPKEIFFKFLPFPLENILFVSSLKPSTTCLLYYGLFNFFVFYSFSSKKRIIV